MTIKLVFIINSLKTEEFQLLYLYLEYKPYIYTSAFLEKSTAATSQPSSPERENWWAKIKLPPF